PVDGRGLLVGSRSNLNTLQPVTDLGVDFFPSFSFYREIDAISFQSSSGGEALQYPGIGTEVCYSLKTASCPIAPVSIEWDDRLSAQIVFVQKAFHRGWQLHIPGREAEKHRVVILNILDVTFERRRVAGFIFFIHLSYDCIVVLGIRGCRLDLHYSSSHLLVDDFRYRPGVSRTR